MKPEATFRSVFSKKHAKTRTVHGKRRKDVMPYNIIDAARCNVNFRKNIFSSEIDPDLFLFLY